jgi:hypothetical protein
MRKIGFYPLVLMGLILLSACAPFSRYDIYSSGPQTYAVALGDLDGDGDLDAYLANGDNYESPVPDRIWLNDGQGSFSDSGYRFEERVSVYVILADLGLDGDLDAIVDDTFGLSIYLNNGSDGILDFKHHSLQQPGGSGSLAPAVGDLNGDGYPDIFAGGCCGWVYFGSEDPPPVDPPTDALWLGTRRGHFVNSGQTFDLFGTKSIALGDLDGDGDLDAFFGNSNSYMDQSREMVRNQPNTVWFNDGKGSFSDSGQRLGESETFSVALGDLDGDGDLDAFAGNAGQDEVWINAGGEQGGAPGTFILGSTVGGAERTRSVELADLDGDGDLDAFVVYQDSARIWINDGAAGFTAGQRLSFKRQHAPAVGDLNGDGYVDVFAGSVDHGLLVWFNDGAGKLTQAGR